jgi:hypothetical protein
MTSLLNSADLREQTRHDAQVVKDLELQRCDAMTQGLWAAVESGTPQAVMAAVRVGERRARLLGLDAATKTELSGSLSGLSEAELKKEGEGLGRYVSEEDRPKVVALVMEAKRIRAEIDAILEPATQRYHEVLQLQQLRRH